MSKQIAIVGAGFAGLHLGLVLQANGVDATIFTDKTPAQLVEGQLLNTVARSAPTIALEHKLGIDYWDEDGLNLRHVRFYVHGDPAISFAGTLPSPASFVDVRVYQARLQEEFVARGGRVVIGTITEADLLELSESYSLVVVASGGKHLTSLFARREDRSPYSQPQRILCAGIYDGIAEGDTDFTFNVSPGHGEIFQGMMYTPQGTFRGLLIEGVPGAGFSALEQTRYQDDPAAFHAAVLDILRHHAPTIYERVDKATFGVTSPRNVLQGAFAPTVRQAYTRLSNGKLIMAVGDAHILNDPIVGQGANTSVLSAWILAEQITAHAVYDEVFCHIAEEAMWAEAQYSTNWANAMLQPPPAHVADLLVGAMMNQAVADRFFEMFSIPRNMWETLSSPEAVARLLAQYMTPELA